MSDRSLRFATVAVLAALGFYCISNLRVTNSITHFIPSKAQAEFVELALELVESPLARKMVLSVEGGPESAAVSVIKPNDGNPATVGNGMMVALAVGSIEKVDEIHAKALELGGADEGPPGERGEGFYVGYFRDLDGNKLNAFHYGAPTEAVD